jgi:DNA-binding NtrC family response regulator
VRDARKIILVESDEGLQRRIEQLIAPLGVSVTSYADRWRAFRKIKREREYDAVLIDEHLAGIGVLRTLFANMMRDLDNEMRFVVLIDSGDEFDSRPFDEHGYENLLPKEVIEPRLRELVAQLLNIPARPATARRKRTTRRLARRERVGAC